MDTLRTGRTEDTARGENEPLAAKPGEKCGPVPRLPLGNEGTESEDEDDRRHKPVCRYQGPYSSPWAAGKGA